MSLTVAPDSIQGLAHWYSVQTIQEGRAFEKENNEKGARRPAPPATVIQQKGFFDQDDSSENANFGHLLNLVVKTNNCAGQVLFVNEEDL